jgi:hypothetical protein
MFYVRFLKTQQDARYSGSIWLIWKKEYRTCWGLILCRVDKANTALTISRLPSWVKACAAEVRNCASNAKMEELPQFLIFGDSAKKADEPNWRGG